MFSYNQETGIVKLGKFTSLENFEDVIGDYMKRLKKINRENESYFIELEKQKSKDKGNNILKKEEKEIKKEGKDEKDKESKLIRVNSPVTFKQKALLKLKEEILVSAATIFNGNIKFSCDMKKCNIIYFKMPYYVRYNDYLKVLYKHETSYLNDGAICFESNDFTEKRNYEFSVYVRRKLALIQFSEFIKLAESITL